MNNLPDNVIQQIFEYRHNMQYVNVMRQLLQAKINVYYNLDLLQCRVMYFVKNNIKYLTLDVNNTNVSPKQLLNVIKHYKKTINYYFFFISLNIL